MKISIRLTFFILIAGLKALLIDASAPQLNSKVNPLFAKLNGSYNEDMSNLDKMFQDITRNSLPSSSSVLTSSNSLPTKLDPRNIQAGYSTGPSDRLATPSVPTSVVNAIQDGRSTFKLYSMYTDDVMETIDLQLDNVFSLLELKFFKNSAFYKRRSHYYLTANLNLFNALPKNRSEQKAQNIYVVEIGIMENILNLLTSEYQALSSVVKLEGNSLVIDYYRYMSEGRQSLLSFGNRTNECIVQAKGKINNLIKLSKLQTLIKNKNLSQIVSTILESQKKIDTLSETLISISPFLNGSSITEANIAKKLFDFKIYSEGVLRDIDKAIGNLQQKYSANQKEMFTVLNQYVSKMGDFKQLNSAFKVLNRMHSKLTNNDRLIVQREAAILFQFENYKKALTQIKSARNQFEIYNRTILQNSKINIGIYAQIIETFYFIIARLNAIAQNNRDANSTNTISLLSDLNQNIKRCSLQLQKLNKTDIEMQTLTSMLQVDNRADNSIGFLLNANKLLRVQRQYIPDLMRKYLELNDDLTSQNSKIFVSLLQSNYTKLTQQFLPNLSQYNASFTQVQKRLEDQISTIKDRYNLKTMRSYRYFINQFKKKQQQGYESATVSTSQSANNSNLQLNSTQSTTNKKSP